MFISLKKLLVSLLSVGVLSSGAQNDSLVRLSDLNYKNDLEKESFSKNNLSNMDVIIDLLMTPYLDKTSFDTRKAKEQINSYANKLKDEISSKTNVKKVKHVYDNVHKQFLKVYKLQTSFQDIFTTGEYNCVSASALYAIFFQKLDIPYSVIEKPNHVYLLAYPQSEKIVIETTSPENGYYQFNTGFINQYVKFLYTSKLISKEEYESNSANSLFDKYYFSSGNLTLRDILGMQYNNYAVYCMEDKKYTETIEEIKKAYIVSDNQRHRYFLKYALIHQIQNNKYEKKDLVNDLAMLFRFNSSEETELSNENLKNEFLRLTESQLIENSNFSFYEQSYQIISKEIKDPELKKEISFIYHYELGRLGYLNDKPLEYELEHLKLAYEAKPKNANLQSIILSYLERQIKQNDNTKPVLEMMDNFSDMFDFLKDNNAFNSVKANCLLELAYEHFTLNELTKGDNCLKEYETLMETKPNVKAGDNFIERAYSTPALLYYKKGNAAKAKYYLKQGLKYSPDNFGLNMRLKQL